MQVIFSKTKSAILLGVSAIALSAFVSTTGLTGFDGTMVGAAFADDHGESGGSGGSKGKKGGGGGHDDDGDTSDHDHTDGDDGGDDGHSSGGKGKGPKAGGDDHGSDSGQGKQGGAGGKGSSGERPVWAKEGIPEVELGRLNVARSPSHVLDRALAEALSEFSDDEAAFYSLSMSDALYALREEFDEQSMIDSPLQNLALLKDALDGTSVLATQVSNTNSNLMALFLGTASDKTVPISSESAYAIAKILGFELSESAAATLGAEAELVRQAVAEGHG